MKKAMSSLMYLLFTLIVLFPTGVLVSAFFGYTFELISISAFAIIIAALSVFTLFFSLISKEIIKNKTTLVLMAVLAPLSLINAAFYIFEYSRFWVVVSAFVSVGCCCFFTAKYGKPLALKITALVLSVLLVLPVGFFSSISLIFSGFGQNTVVQTVESPSGKYYAEVVDSDQGALGGDTLVDVYEQSGINAIIFKIEKKPQRVYFGEYGEFENMRVYWEDDGCLVINSVVYEIE